MPARLQRHPLSLVAAALAAFGCGGRPDDACAVSVQAPLVGGDESAALLLDDVTPAVVEVTMAGEPPPKCSGVLVAPDQVLTAAHCIDFGVPTRVTAPGGTRRVIEVDLHDSLDLALLRLEPSETPESSGAALPLLDEPIDGDWVGVLVQIAGVGAGSSGPSFLVSEVTAVEATTIAVSSHGAGGACAGDSGGPLLVRGRDGSVRVAGVLRSGSSSCRGVDLYTRLDVAMSWFELRVAAVAPAPSCGTLGVEGRCYGDRAVWCDGAAVHADRARRANRWDQICLAA